MSTSPSQPPPDQEFVVRIPARNARKTHHVMKFNGSLKMDLTKWSQGSVRMVRENNQKKSAVQEEEQPKFGAGSEFGREQREEARRKKFGIKSKKYDPHAQPWLIRVGDKKSGKRYRGIREGGVSENASYYVFTHAQDGAFEAHPISEWYNFSPIQTYKTLNAEEAEEQFAHRGKILNHWALMVNKKLRPDADNLDDLDGEGGGSSKKKSSGKKGDSSFKISDMDDWVESGDELDSDSEGEGKKKKKDDDDDDGKKKKGKDAKMKKKKSKHDVDNEAFEDSDDGDDECREVDYMSDESSDSETEAEAKLDSKGVDQDKGLAKMLDSESSSEDEDDPNKKKKDSNSDNSDKSDGEENGDGKKKKGKKDKKKSGKRSGSNSRAGTPEPSASSNKADKRKALVDNVMDLNDQPAPKKTRLDQFATSTPSVSTPLSSNESALEEDVRRYLMRKPMTTTELVKKINSKKFQDLPREELMPLLLNVLKKVNPIKTKTKGIMYLSLKSDKP